MSLLLADLVGLADAAKLAGVHLVTVWRWAESGKIPSHRTAGHILIPRGALMLYVESRAARLSEANALAAARRWANASASPTPPPK